jgi:hypothetical protein
MQNKDYKKFQSEIISICNKYGYFWIIEGHKNKGSVRFYDLTDPGFKNLHAFAKSVLEDLEKPYIPSSTPIKPSKK